MGQHIFLLSSRLRHLRDRLPYLNLFQTFFPLTDWKRGNCQVINLLIHVKTTWYTVLICKVLFSCSCSFSVCLLFLNFIFNEQITIGLHTHSLNISSPYKSNWSHTNTNEEHKIKIFLKKHRKQEYTYTQVQTNAGITLVDIIHCCYKLLLCFTINKIMFD